MTNQITLHILSTRQQLVIPLKGKTILGRSATVEADGTTHVDLSPFLAYQLGVSRRHLMLAPDDEDILAFDLNSNNGSFVNGVRLTAGNGHRIKDGDELTLGSLTMRVYLSGEVPYSHMQTRQLKPIDEKELDENAIPGSTDLVSPTPDIRETLTTRIVPRTTPNKPEA